MKRVFTFVLVALITLNGVFAGPVTPDRAGQIAKNFLIRKSTFNVSDNISLIMLKDPALNQVGDELTVQNRQFFVFNHGNEQGFVIVSADDRTSPILGYADSGAFDPNNIPPNMQKWLEGYKAEIRYACENNITASEEIQAEWNALATGSVMKTSNGAKSVSNLCQTRWNQSSYYNAMCPYDNTHRERAVTGCVATAMAQVMKYWNYPTTGVGFHSYNHESYGTLNANFGSTTYQWSSMPNTVSSSNSAVATLMYHCGVAVDMDYGVGSTGGSAAYVISSASPLQHCTEYALKTYFGYKSTLQGIKKANYTSSNWTNLLKTELDAGRPIVYAGFGNGGHCFVCDGYDNNNYFHFNWGWGGSYDGYFALNALNPGSGGVGGGSYSYNDGQQAIIGIEPANNGDGGTTNRFNLKMYEDLSCSASRYWFGSEIKVTAKVGNYGTGSFSGTIAAAVFNEEGYFIDFLQQESISITNGYYNTMTFTNTGGAPFIPGCYLVAVFYKTSTQDWTIVADNTNAENLNQFEVYYSSNIETNSAFTITTNNGKLIQGSSATVNVDVINSGSSTFIGRYRVNLANLDGSWAQNIQILNETNGLPSGYHYRDGNNFTGIITIEPGTYLMEIAYQKDGTSVWYYCGSSDYSNPVYVIVEAQALQPDIYEPNNTQTQASNLPVNFSGNQATVETTGSNLHIGTDIDYYKIVLPSGYNYAITPRLHDNYNSGNGQSYTVDALFSYSTNGTAYSETYDDVFSGNIPITNGGTVYFMVAPYFSGSAGTYLLSINITRSSVTGIENIPGENMISVYPNPAQDFIIIDLQNFPEKIKKISITDLQGRQIFSENINNFERTINIPLTSISDGIYFVQIHSDKGILNKKIIVKK